MSEHKIPFSVSQTYLLENTQVAKDKLSTLFISTTIS